MATKTCPLCGASVKLENFDHHLWNRHPRERIDVRDVLNDEERRRIRESHAVMRPRITRKGIRLVAIVAAVLAVLLASYTLNPFRGVGPNPGQVAPDFTLKTSTGGDFALSSDRGHVVLLEFFDVDCPYCVQEAPVLASVYDAYRLRDVRFVSVDANFIAPKDTPARIEAFKQEHGTDWTYVLDSGRTVSNAYRVSATPTCFILDRNSVVRSVLVGRASGGYADYASALDVALGA